MVESGGGAKVCDTLDEAIEFANALLGSEPEMFECKREICAELSGTSSGRFCWWVKEITFDVGAHDTRSITLTLS